MRRVIGDYYDLALFSGYWLMEVTDEVSKGLLVYWCCAAVG